jgi:hypothetical protein
MADAETPTASRAAIQAAWTVAIGIGAYLLVNLVIDLLGGRAEPTLAYAGHLVVSLGVLITAVPLIIGIVVFTLCSAAGGYGSLPLSARAEGSS